MVALLLASIQVTKKPLVFSLFFGTFCENYAIIFKKNIKQNLILTGTIPFFTQSPVSHDKTDLHSFFLASHYIFFCEFLLFNVFLPADQL